MDHTQTMRGHAAEFNAAVSRFLTKFEEFVTNQSRLGTLFKVEDYPGISYTTAELTRDDAPELPREINRS
jgi:hypothetical protein